MSEQPNSEGIVDLSFAGHVQSICRQFAAAWEEALNGSEPPRVEWYLRQAAEPERSTLHRELCAIAEKYEERRLRQRETGKDPSRTLPVEGAAAESMGGVTEDLSGDGRLATEGTLAPGEVAVVDMDTNFVLSDPKQSQVERTSEITPLPADLAATEVMESSADGAADTDASRVLADQKQSQLERTSEFTPSLGDPAAAGELEPSAQPTGERSAASPTALPRVPGYVILEELGRGGMGVVYKARQARLNRVVALKMVLAGAHASSHQLARFHAEAEAVAQLQHPNIVQIFEVGDRNGLPFFSLEFVEGGSLADKIDGKPRPPREAAETVEVLAQAMAVAHQHGIIHRDLKPANVLLTKDDLPKITDFGLAKRIEGDSDLTKSGILMGSPSYMSPEQARGKPQEIGPLSDLYSLGVILYELLTGRPPFVGTSLLETLDQVRNQEPVPPSRLQPKVPHDLETICLKCLQKEAGKRYASCTALADDLHRFSTGEPIRARPVGRAERLGRWCRRNPRVAALSGVVAVLFGLLTASAIAIGMRLSREREAVAETRKIAGERLDRAAAAIAAGDSQRAGDLLQQANLPMLNRSPELADIRSQMRELQEQVDVYAEFKKILDQARFSCFGSLSQKKEGQRYCRRLVELYDQIETHTGAAASGLPPLNDEQQRRFNEDVFDAFLIAAIVERDLAENGEESLQKQAAQRALDLLNRANKVVPDSKAFYANRCACWGKLGDPERDAADRKRAKAIVPTTAVDHFWHGFANHLRGDQALRKGDRKAAEKWYREELAEYADFLRLRPDHFWGYFNWSLAHVQLGDWQEALFGFTACIRLRPDFPWSYNNRGNMLLRLKRYDLAIEDCTAALARDEHYFAAYENRGLAYLAQGKNEQALRDFNRAIELKPKHAPLYMHRATTYRRMNRLTEALPDADHAVALNGNNAQAYSTRAGIRMAARQYAPARDDYSAALALAPRAANILQDRTLLNWMHLKDFDAAVADAEQLAKLQPRNPVPHRILGSIYLGRRHYDKALDAFKKALDLKRDYPEVLWAVAQIHLWQGDANKALQVMDPLIAHLSPESPQSLNVRGDIYRSLSRLEDAAKDYQRLIELRPKKPDAYISLALVLTRQGKAEQAAACYDRMVAANPDSALVYLRRAEFHRDRGAFEEAESDCDRAAGKDAESALPALVRASILAARGQHQSAVADAERALKKAPKDDGHVLYAAACVWSLASQVAAAEADQAQRYADRAAAFLVLALDKGFHDLIFPEHNRMLEDAALAAIRRQPQIDDLLAHRGRQ
jgi:tetratricopeptide (TPR) repeat protein/tRNA A-37 threonylcarbamoyl transferase component Bud32